MGILVIKHWDDVPNNYTGITQHSWHKCIEYWRNGKRHREDGAAVIWPQGDLFWYFNGKLMLLQQYWEIQKHTIHASKIMSYVLGAKDDVLQSTSKKR